MLILEKATFQDIPALVRTSKAAFEGDIALLGGGSTLSGPPGYDSTGFYRRMLGYCDFYAIRVDEKLAGGAMVGITRGQARNTFELMRIWLDPAYQHKLLGTQSMEQLMGLYPSAKIWVLETPLWAVRNHKFFEKMGFVKQEETAEGQVQYRKRNYAGVGGVE